MFKTTKPKDAFKALPAMKAQVPKAPAAEIKDTYPAPPPADDTVDALKSEIQKRHMSMYANPSEVVPQENPPGANDNYFTKLRNLLRVKYSGGRSI